VQLALIIADRSNTLKRCAPFKSLQTIPYNVGGNFDVSAILEMTKPFAENFGWLSGVKASTVRN